MNTSAKSKRKLEKFVNSSGSRDKNKNKDINKLNLSGSNKDNNFNNSTEKRKYKYEYSNLRGNDYTNTLSDEEEEKNILSGLIKEGFISMDEYNENQFKNDKNFNIDKLSFKEVDFEKILQKIIFLNKSLKNTQSERKKLENEYNIYSNSLNESKSNTISYQEKDNLTKNNINKIEIKEKNNTIPKYNYSSILKKYEDDLKFFKELIQANNLDDI